MMRNILLMNGNPKEASFAKQLSDTYEDEASKKYQVSRFNLSEMNFNPSLENGYDEIQPLEPGLIEFQQSVLIADHIVIVAPIWWGGLPAKLKGLFDRTFLPGFAFKFEDDNPEPVQLLKGKTSRLILTMDAPSDYATEQAQPIMQQLDQFTLQFSGVSKAEHNLFGSVILSDREQQHNWLQTVKDVAAVGR
ncbi:NAD(P)H-dependent oxidoreductase [Vibrio sp. DW001]|uniref:NAD(P)H-dependent oxidoreductase n=1 Tax=Vibrio sp. DW001 TaxID=2912315 RepID=UPI0023B0F909|nr:NAD(P)H-dependent oxidoreductase [Vibrio sp. DW001]WED27758.1 NAD(P)H-dependent oxidoreductase [Vibrio sp. DW001]